MTPSSPPTGRQITSARHCWLPRSSGRWKWKAPASQETERSQYQGEGGGEREYKAFGAKEAGGKGAAGETGHERGHEIATGLQPLRHFESQEQLAQEAIHLGQNERRQRGDRGDGEHNEGESAGSFHGLVSGGKVIRHAPDKNLWEREGARFCRGANFLARARVQRV